MDLSLEGWSIGTADAAWAPWGADDKARAQVLASGDGYLLVLVEAQPSYRSMAHEHLHTEFLFVLDGVVDNQGDQMKPGGGYIAAAGSTHAGFGSERGARYLSIFKL
jgi:hypothetical protein